MLPEKIDLYDEYTQQQAIEAEIDTLNEKRKKFSKNDQGIMLPDFCGTPPTDGQTKIIGKVMNKIKHLSYGDANYFNIEQNLYKYACNYKNTLREKKYSELDENGKLKRIGGYRKKRSRSKSSKKRKSFSVKRKNQRKKSRKGRTSRKGRKSRK